MYKFAAASAQELMVFGSARPGYREEQVMKWMAFMQNQGIQRVCCLLDEIQLTGYSNLLESYRQTFGIDRVCWAPIADFHIAHLDLLRDKILPFLADANQRQEKVIVHCAGGIGRTGQVLAAWLVAGRGFSPKAAIAAVQKTGRNPKEAVMVAPLMGRNPRKLSEELNSLLDECSRFREVLAN